MKEKLFFYYTSDIHSHFENWGKIVQFFNKKKEQRNRNNESYWLLDNGDHVDRFHPITEASMGKKNVDLLNQAGYHVATLGNNEGITLDHDSLCSLYDDANFDVVCANLICQKEDKPAWLQPSIKLNTNGITIGVIGLTAPFNAFYHLLDWHVNPPLEVLDEHIRTLASETDIIILLSHLGINEDEIIAARYPEIDVIIGGHTHHLFRDGEIVNNTLLTAAGKHGNYVGEVILTWDHSERKLTKKEAYTTAVAKLETNEKMEQLLKSYEVEAVDALKQPIIHTESGIKADWYKETPLMQMLVDTLKEWTNADIAMLNAGVILESLQAGTITYGDIHRICPHPINPCLVEIKGNELVEVIRQSFTKQFMELPLKGFGFRGKVIGKMIYSGLEISIQKKPTGDYQVLDVKKNGIPIDRQRKYHLATADTFTFGQLLPGIAHSSLKKFFLPEFLRDLLVYTLEKNSIDL